MKRKDQKNGFSLVEILVVIMFIGIGLVGVLSFFSSSMRSHNDAKNELIAAALAQEGAELVRNLADYKKLNGDSWNTIKSSLATCVRIDYRSLSGSPHACNNGANSNVCFSSGRYQQCNSGSGDMQRTISISDGGANGLIIISQVVWNDRTTTATDRLYENSY
jgi:prepilin-type N-terminal cleavage/methylation domain-containing protein